ncbi:unnamed protein product [Brachionus calyciflorus]|uniref:Ankyrin repeat domain-containing protein n=1 Tax=Brachionus calyciflorus TaxID=104777 RepID=A0A813TXD1_9BILA|nr:unnamed protein product [Brachionus calyciflorus]
MPKYENDQNTLKKLYFESVKSNKIDQVIDCLQKGISVNSRDEENSGKTALHYIAESNLKDMFNLLMAYKPDINIEDDNGQVPLATAILYDDFEIARSLIKNGSILPERIQEMYPEFF